MQGGAGVLRLDGLELAQGGFRLCADWALPDGVTAVIGASGAGKSTLLSAIAGFLAPDAGAIHWGDTRLDPLRPGDRPLAMLFQDNNLFPHLTAAQNVGLGLRPARRLTVAEQAQVSAALDRVGLAGLGTRRPAALSGGQQGRVALARLLVSPKPLILMDEPFAALGPGLKAEMLGLVQEVLLCAGKTVLMVTHDPADAQRIADHTVLVHDGRANPPAPTGPLFTDPPAALRSYLGM